MRRLTSGSIQGSVPNRGLIVLAMVVVLAVVAAGSTGCAGGGDAGGEAASPQGEAAVDSPATEPTTDQVADAGTAPGEAPAPAPAPARASTPKTTTAPPPKPTAPEPAPAPRFETVTIPEGTVVAIAFEGELSSETAVAGDAFTARATAPIATADGDVLPSGTLVYGEVVEAVPTKKIGGTARLNLQFTGIELPDGSTAPLSAVFLAEGKRQTKKDAATIGGAAAGGALLGNLIGSKKGKEADGTKIGAVVGAAVGTAVAATNQTDPVILAPGTIVDIRLDAPVRFERRI